MTSDALPAETFARRRSRLMRRLRAGSAAIFAAGHDALRNGDVEHPYRQPSTFYYLTGFDEPDAVAVLRPGHDEPFVLFVRPFDPAMAIWVGARLGVEGAVEELGADAAYPIEELEQRLPQLLGDASTVYYSLGSDDRLERLLLRTVAQRRAAAQGGARPIEAIMDPAPLVAAQRLIKSREEVAALQSAIDITGAGIEAAMRATRPGMHEYEVQAILESEYRRLGSPRDGFPSIVAAGENACTLHYTANRAEMARDELLLVDTGAEVDFYGADVTRTYPVDGRFRAAARDVYELVLEAQEQAIALVQPGVRFHDVHDKAAEVLTQGLVDLGVLSGDTRQPHGGAGVRTVLHAWHLALARDGCPRRRALPRGRGVGGAAARDGADGGAGAVLRARHPRGASPPARHRRPHRGRRAGHARWLPRAVRGHPEAARRPRSNRRQRVVTSGRRCARSASSFQPPQKPTVRYC